MQKQTPHTARYLQQRKFFLMLPLLVFPFLTVLLWSIGIIGATDIQAQRIMLTGFNQNLPDALPSVDSNWNKLRFYEEADKDSARYKTMQNNDPNYSLSLSKPAERNFFDTIQSTKINKPKALSYDPYPVGLQTGRDANEEKVYRKLAQLNSELSKTKDSDQTINDTLLRKMPAAADPSNLVDINRLENMMQTMQGTDNTGDPELQQIGGMLEKILDIQHPERVTDKLKKQSEIHKQQVYPVTNSKKRVPVSLLQPRLPDNVKSSSLNSTLNTFYSLDEAVADEGEHQNSISAIIPETQTLVAGATVKLRLTTEVFINGLLIPKGEFIYGTAALEGERLIINVNKIRFQNNILPVALSVYDLDGMAGIYVPGAISRDVAKQSTEQAIQGLGLASLDPSIGMQAASAGIQAAKSLIGKKIKQIKVTVVAGYQVLLRDDNQNNRLSII